MAKAPHPADLSNADMIANAVRFEVSLFLGAGRYCKDSAPDMGRARDMADKMREANPDCSRRPLIYAITADGRSGVVAEDGQTIVATVPAPAAKIAKLVEVANHQEPAMHAVKIQNDRSNAQKRRASFAARFPDVTFEVLPNDAGKGFVVRALLDAETAHHAKVLADQGVAVLKSAAKKPAPAARKGTLDRPIGIASPKAAAKAPKAAAKAPKAAAKPAKAAPKPAAGDRPLGKRAQILADAQAGKMPKVPDFTAETHTRFRGKLAEVVALAKAGDIKGLKAFHMNPVSTSPKAICRYRDLCVIALEAKAKAAKAA